MTTLRTELLTQSEEIRRLREALAGLVNRLDEVHDDERYQSVWVLYQIHGGKYTEPTYTEALENARRALELKP